VLSRLPWTPKPSGKKLRDRGAAARRETMTAAVVGILDCGRSSRFEYEAACRHGLRSGLCLEGESWARADAFAAAIVSEALRRLGAERPSWFQGQPEYADTDTSRGWCALPGCEKPIPIDRPETGGNAVKYCSHFCAKNASAQRQREHGARMDLASYLASCAARREATLQASAKECAHCGRHFLSKATNAKAYCSRACAYAARTQFSRRPCANCGKVFKPKRTGHGKATLFCSVACAASARTKEKPTRNCERCGATFALRDRSEKKRFCSVACKNAAQTGAKRDGRKMPDQEA
jgi:endogenous inhibitor of DNA gyrase (YacG/DUF329 family)